MYSDSLYVSEFNFILSVDLSSLNCNALCLNKKSDRLVLEGWTNLISSWTTGYNNAIYCRRFVVEEDLKFSTESLQQPMKEKGFETSGEQQALL